ncbi:MAG: cyclase family protein [Geminicoccaceae bacterium]|nr:MAG: cyclase family protein [Geminicoccaceae bacterium]
MLRGTSFTACLAATTWILSSQAMACSVDDWQACAGKPWVVGDTMETPIGERWWPHPIWGEGDQAGATNWYRDPEVVARGLAEVQGGKVYSLGHVYDDQMPLFGNRVFAMRIPGGPTGGPFGSNHVIWNDEFLATEIGQVGTQFDGLSHIGVQVGATTDKADMIFYNGFTQADVGGTYGTAALGTEHLHPIVGRGILLDIAAARGVDMMDAGDEITMADVQAALERQGMAEFAFAGGDVVLFHTGWSQLWKVDNERYNSGEPGIGAEVALWLSDEVQAGVVGADVWAVEAVPNPDPACIFCVHQHLLVRHGILLQENMRLDDLIADEAWTFLYMYSPVPIAGATGSIGAPIAVR